MTRGAWPACALLLLASAGTAADDPERDDPAATALTLSLDPHLSLETGTDVTRSFVWLAAVGDERLFAPLDRRPLVRRTTRAAWGLLVDAPIAYWFAILLHEAFGHGGRAREFGTSAGFHMGSPWENRSSYATFDPEGLTSDDLLRVFVGGSEANGFAATRIERELVAGRALRPLELLYLVGNRYVVSRYVLGTTPHPGREPLAFYREWRGGGDVANYLGFLSQRYTGEPGITPTGSSELVLSEYRRLRRHAVWNALDPGAWLALLGAGRAMFGGGEAAPVPLPRVAGRRVLPVLSADWLPDGGVRSLEVVVGPRADGVPERRARWSSFVVRRGRGPGGDLTSVGAASESVVRTSRLRLGGDLELWDRPGRGLGGGIRLRLSPARGRLRGMFVEVGVKSAGHWPGRPAEPGAMLRLGARIPA